MRGRIITFTIFFILIPGLVFAQGRMLKGQVLFVGDNDETKPAVGVDVTLKETGDTAKTKSMGLFRIFLPDIFKTGEKVTLQVKKEGWRIQYPLDGEARIPANLIKETVEVRLLPVGSKKFWSDDRIKKFIEDMAQKAKEQVTPEGKPEDIDFIRYIKEWAIQYGFSARQAKEEIDKWIAEVEKKDDYFELGLAAYAKKKFGEAGKLLSLAAKSKAKELKALKEKEASLTEETVRSYRLAGDAYYNDYKFEAALASYEQAVQYIDKEKSPRLWADVYIEIGLANCKIGIRTGGEAINQHLSAAVSAYQLVLEVYTREFLPQYWAAVQNNLGVALQCQGIRTGGKESARLLGQAVDAYRLALEVVTRESLPQQWATTQNNLGIALRYQGIRMVEKESALLLGQSVAAYRLALKVRTRESLPQQWATTQNNLGVALRYQGIIGGEEGALLFGQSAAAYRLALEVRTRESLPQDWAMTQNNLGIALRDQGIRTAGKEGALLLGQSVAAYRLALKVRTREFLPQQWATTQNNLGTALRKQGIRTGGKEGALLLGQSVAAYRLALEVRTRESLPQQWAMTQNNLGHTLRDQSIRTGGKEGALLLDQSVAAYRLALEIRTRESLPQQWAITQNNLAKAYVNLKDWPNAVAAYANVLKVYPGNQKAHNTLVLLYHERLFDFNKAFEINESWLKRHPDDFTAKIKLAGEYFTTGRFVESEERIQALLTNPQIKAEQSIPLLAIQIANLAALEKTAFLHTGFEALQEPLSAQPDEFKVTWSFKGVKQFIRLNAKLTSHRKWLIALFDALGGKDRGEIQRLLEKVKSELSKVVVKKGELLELKT